MTQKIEFEVDPSWKGLIKWGGFSLFLAGVIVIIFIVGLGVFDVELPLDPIRTLENPIIPTILFLITLCGEFLLFPGFLALYLTLKKNDKVKMLMATVLCALSVVMFFVSRGLIFTMSKIDGNYKDAIDSGMYVVAAEVALKVQDVYSTIALILLSLASIFVGTVILKSKFFSIVIGYIVIFSGLFSIITPFAVNLGIPLFISLIGLVLMLIWQVYVGVRLFQLGNNT
jgi:hypothetical protein